MQVTGLGQAGLAIRAGGLLHVRPISIQNASQVSSSFAQPVLLRDFSSRKVKVMCSSTEDYTPAKEIPKQNLNLPISSEEAPRSDDNSNTDAESNVYEEEKLGTVSEVFEGAVKAVKEAPALTVAQWILFGAVGTFGLAVSSSILKTLAFFPFAPEALQTVGVAYSLLLASQVIQGKSISFPPPSPFKAMVQFADSGETSSEATIQEKSKDDPVLRKLVKERDTAVKQMQEMKKAAVSIARVKAEKEALEAVSLQLADERDGAMAEVAALKDAVVAMTNRIKAIEEMLDREVSQLKKQNEALETVALQLAAERDSAVQEAEDLKETAGAYSQLQEQMQGLETVAVELAHERDTALAEIEDLKKVVANLRESASTASGLSSEQELFIKARVRALRSQFIDVDRAYDEQKEEVDRFIGHLVQEYGAPQEWTKDYIRQFLDTSATKSRLGEVSGGMSRLENRTAQRST
ncbi:hypothetical protein R1sor_001072 [Riccia sorocarpa]|uniref:Uncharacterized protein n=1 Tax=Riccia sorocarpa TaxID=122646 RepID=A0ABD3GY60_9MARC